MSNRVKRRTIELYLTDTFSHFPHVTLHMTDSWYVTGSFMPNKLELVFFTAMIIPFVMPYERSTLELLAFAIFAACVASNDMLADF